MKITRGIWSVGLAMLVGFSFPLLVWVAIISAFQQIFSEWRATKAWLMSANLTCNIDGDCPPGYQCIGGSCIPEPLE
jgi:hypothetical protein